VNSKYKIAYSDVSREQAEKRLGFSFDRFEDSAISGSRNIGRIQV